MMHRRTIAQLSRRHAVDWPGTARLQTVSVAHPSRRCFHPSLSNPNSSDQPPSNNAATPSDPPSSNPKPKFGNRWGARPTSQPAGLSAEEQAIRDALLKRTAARQQKEHERIQREAQREAQRTLRAQQQQQLQQQSQRSRADSRLVSGAGHNGPRPRKDLPYVFMDDKKSQDLQPLKQFEVNGSSRIPLELRARDWTCPDCSAPCLGKHTTCPQCKARRPELNRIPKKWKENTLFSANARQPAPSGLPFDLAGADWWCSSCGYHCFGRHRLSTCPVCKTPRPGTQRVSLEPNSRGSPLPSHPNRGSSEDTFTVRRISSDKIQSDTKESAMRRHLDLKNKKEAKKEAKKGVDQWTWDASALERLRPADDEFGDVDDGKRSRRRGDRRLQAHEAEANDDFDADEYQQRREERKRLKKEKAQKKKEPEASPLHLPEFISVSNFADVIGMRPAHFVRRLEEMGFEDVSFSHVLDSETAGLVATEFGFDPVFDVGAENDLTAAPIPEDTSIWPSRPPVVTIMGHVDHGKTTILDWLRESSVAASEHGGITQHIGAFSVSMPSGKTITFLDTPGHAAFLDMRRRGADVTDIVVLVVAADDSVKPQTIEAIKHATSAKVPIIVAMSKIDKPGINPEKVKQDLSVHGIHVEDFGGDVQAIGVSGKTGQGMLDLEEAIVTLSEVLDHRADPNGVVEGWVIEGTTKSYGRVATVLVRRGTIRPGDILVAGSTWTRVRTLRNEAGISISEATPGMPVEIDGWRDQPTAGTEFLQAGDEQHAKEVVEYRLEREETSKLSEDTTAINEARREVLDRRQREAEGEEADEKPSGPKPVHFIIKADVGGSAEAVLNSVTALGNNEVYANVLRSEVGQISEFDIEHAATANGHIISFNMPIDPAISRMAELKGVNIMDHNIIYKLVDNVKEVLSDQLAPLITQRVVGEADIGQIFEISLKGRDKMAIAGCKVRNGIINRAKKVRVIRDKETIYDGTITSLKNVKKDVTEMRKDTECGIGFEKWSEFAIGDQIQCYEETSEKRTL
ncbi:hypothetical protein BJY04DRAFT_85441 [Aspergillus karnatakaensis]|uniref:translation initiation factor 2 n=1 Tax=Aspergillus karnatakaensis TaxID=1810916 RepID=UPI003CCCA090